MFEIIKANDTESKGVKLFINGNTEIVQDIIKRIVEEQEINDEISEEDIKIIIYDGTESNICWNYDKMKKSDILAFWLDSNGNIFETISVSKKTLIIGSVDQNIISSNNTINTKHKIIDNFDKFYSELVETLYNKISNYRIKNITSLK